MFGRISDLEDANFLIWDRIKQAESRQKWCPAQSPDYVRMFGLEEKVLTASEIIQRFDELYEFLGVERKSTPSNHKLEKKAKP